MDLIIHYLIEERVDKNIVGIVFMAIPFPPYDPFHLATFQQLLKQCIIIHQYLDQSLIKRLDINKKHLLKNLIIIIEIQQLKSSMSIILDQLVELVDHPRPVLPHLIQEPQNVAYQIQRRNKSQSYIHI